MTSTHRDRGSLRLTSVTYAS